MVQVVGLLVSSQITVSSQNTLPSTANPSTVVSAIPLAGIVGGAVALAVVLVIVVVLLTGCLVVAIHRKRNEDMVQVGLPSSRLLAMAEWRIKVAYVLPQNIDPHNVESLTTEQETVAIQHGTPAIDKLMRRARQRHQHALSSLALLASSRQDTID